jgi:2-keto-4-pentenoate hydratase
MFNPALAARFFDEAHRQRATYRNLPPELAAKSVEEAYAAQEALCELWQARFGPVAGLKIATTTRVMQQLMGIDHPCGGMIFASRIHRSRAAIDKADFVNLRIECELAVRVGRDLPRGAAAHTRESVRAAVAEVMAAFELIDDRHADYKSCSALSLIADNAWNGGIVVGAGMAPARGLELSGIAGRLLRNGREVAAGQTDDPLGALAWLANLAAERGRPIQAGMVVITGSVVATVDVAAGEQLVFALDAIGDVVMTAR